MQELFDRAFARMDRVGGKRDEFAQCWASYISAHPWDVDVRSVSSRTMEILAVMREPAPYELALIFSEWLAALRASLDNAIYALAAAVTGQNPPPHGGRIQFPICSTPEDFQGQANRLTMLPAHFLVALEQAQPYQSPWGPESNLTWWVNELARKDRHRELHVGLGRVDEHRVRIYLPSGITAEFDKTVEPYSHIEQELVVARFTVSRTLSPGEVTVDLTGVGIAPEILAWADYKLDGRRQSLVDRMFYTEMYIRNHLENMALEGGSVPPGGFRTFDPSKPKDEE